MLSLGTNALAISSVGVPTTGSMGEGASPSGAATPVSAFLPESPLVVWALRSDFGSDFLPNHNQAPRPTMPSNSTSVMMVAGGRTA